MQLEIKEDDFNYKNYANKTKNSTFFKESRMQENSFDIFPSDNMTDDDVFQLLLNNTIPADLLLKNLFDVSFKFSDLTIIRTSNCLFPTIQPNKPKLRLSAPILSLIRTPILSYYKGIQPTECIEMELFAPTLDFTRDYLDKILDVPLIDTKDKAITVFTSHNNSIRYDYVILDPILTTMTSFYENIQKIDIPFSHLDTKLLLDQYIPCLATILSDIFPFDNKKRLYVNKPMPKVVFTDVSNDTFYESNTDKNFNMNILSIDYSWNLNRFFEVVGVLVMNDRLITIPYNPLHEINIINQLEYSQFNDPETVLKESLLPICKSVVLPSIIKQHHVAAKTVTLSSKHIEKVPFSTKRSVDTFLYLRGHAKDQPVSLPSPPKLLKPNPQPPLPVIPDPRQDWVKDACLELELMITTPTPPIKRNQVLYINSTGFIHHRTLCTTLEQSFTCIECDFVYTLIKPFYDACVFVAFERGCFLIMPYGLLGGEQSEVFRVLIGYAFKYEWVKVLVWEKFRGVYYLSKPVLTSVMGIVSMIEHSGLRNVEVLMCGGVEDVVKCIVESVDGEVSSQFSELGSVFQDSTSLLYKVNYNLVVCNKCKENGCAEHVSGD